MPGARSARWRAERLPRLERLRDRRERERHVGQAVDDRCLAPQSTGRAELVGDRGVGCAVGEVGGLGAERPHPGDVEWPRVRECRRAGLGAAGHELADDDMRDEPAHRLVVVVPEVDLERVHPSAGAARREPIRALVVRGLQRDRKHAVPVGVELERVERRADLVRERDREAPSGWESRSSRRTPTASTTRSWRIRLRFSPRRAPPAVGGEAHGERATRGSPRVLRDQQQLGLARRGGLRVRRPRERADRARASRSRSRAPGARSRPSQRASENAEAVGHQREPGRRSRGRVRRGSRSGCSRTRGSCDAARAT